MRMRMLRHNVEVQGRDAALSRSVQRPKGARLSAGLEDVAALEHEQWAHWTRYMLDNLTPENVKRWRRQIDTPYAELSDAEKMSDRVWALRVINLVSSNVK